MQRRFVTFLAVVAVLAMPALASAAVTITAGSANIIQGNSAVVDVIITSDAGEGLNSADLDILLGGFFGFSPAPVATALDLNGVGTLFAQNASTLFPGLDPPSDTELFQSIVNDASVNSVIGASSILARVTFDTTGVPLGAYPWTLDDNQASAGGAAGTVLFSTSAEVVPTQINGGFINVVPVPEPASVVLGLFAAAGLASVVIRRRRSA